MFRLVFSSLASTNVGRTAQSRCSACPRGPPCRCEATCRLAPGCSISDRACCGGASRPGTASRCARPAGRAWPDRAPWSSSRRDLRAFFEVNGGPDLVRDRITFGGVLTRLVETRREAQPTPPGGQQTLGLLRIGSYTRTDPQTRDQVEAQAQQAAGHTGVRALLAEQKQAWATRWEEADVEVVGDPELTRAIRLAIFHLMGSVADGGEAAVGRGGSRARRTAATSFGTRTCSCFRSWQPRTLPRPAPCSNTGSAGFPPPGNMPRVPA